MVNSGRVPSMPSYLSAKLKDTVRSMLTLNVSQDPPRNDEKGLTRLDIGYKTTVYYRLAEDS